MQFKSGFIFRRCWQGSTDKFSFHLLNLNVNRHIAISSSITHRQSPYANQKHLFSTFNSGEINNFRTNGFVMKENIITSTEAVQLRKHYQQMFDGDFSTGIFPDEWHWRNGISLPGAFREIVNGWKSSHTVARVSLSEKLGQLASELMGWPNGARMGQDDLLWKPPGASGVTFHQDSAYISTQFKPLQDNSVTIWIALDAANKKTGVVKYACGSHQWGGDDSEHDVGESDFHGNNDYLYPVRKVAEKANKNLDIKSVEVPVGAAIFHHQNTWHGSGRNTTSNQPRRALGVHLINRDVQFREDPPPDYIYGRYKRWNSTKLDETFFPVVWSPDGYVSPIVKKLLS